MHHYRLGAELLEGNRVEKNLGHLVDSRLDLRQKHAIVAKKAKSILVCIRKSVASMLREVILLLFCSALMCLSLYCEYTFFFFFLSVCV